MTILNIYKYILHEKIPTGFRSILLNIFCTQGKPQVKPYSFTLVSEFLYTPFLLYLNLHYINSKL